jgi:hypothetical protein
MLVSVRHIRQYFSLKLKTVISPSEKGNKVDCSMDHQLHFIIEWFVGEGEC